MSWEQWRGRNPKRKHDYQEERSSSSSAAADMVPPPWRPQPKPRPRPKAIASRPQPLVREPCSCCGVQSSEWIDTSVHPTKDPSQHFCDLCWYMMTLCFLMEYIGRLHVSQRQILTDHLAAFVNNLQFYIDWAYTSEGTQPPTWPWHNEQPEDVAD